MTDWSYNICFKLDKLPITDLAYWLNPLLATGLQSGFKSLASGCSNTLHLPSCFCRRHTLVSCKQDSNHWFTKLLSCRRILRNLSTYVDVLYWLSFMTDSPNFVHLLMNGAKRLKWQTGDSSIHLDQKIFSLNFIFKG